MIAASNRCVIAYAGGINSREIRPITVLITLVNMIL